MENASKALMIAAGVILGIMLLSVIVITFAGASGLAKNYDDKMQTTSLQAFNNKFEKYADGTYDIRTVISLANYVKDYNRKNEFNDKDDGYYISVFCHNGIETKRLEILSDKELIDYIEKNSFLEEEQGTKSEYKCNEIQYSNVNGKVIKISFKKVNK